MLETPKALFSTDGTATKIITMDNQQERLLSWLGGFIDGEGRFGIYHYRNGRVMLHHPVIDIVNTNPLDIDKAVGIIRTYTGANIDVKNTKGRVLPCWSIRVVGYKRNRTLLPIIIPYLHGKQEEAKLVLEFCFSPDNFDIREDYKARLKLLKNPQRLYARQFEHLRIEDKVRQIVKTI